MSYRNYSSANSKIVDPSGNGDFTTISAALTAASSGQTIFIRPGTYTENLTLKAGVNLCAFSCDAFTPNVSIVGKATMTVAGSCTISGIRLTTNSDFFLAVTGSAASIVTLENCYLNVLNNTGISYTSSSASSRVIINRSAYVISLTSITLFSSTGAGNIVLKYLIADAGSATTVASTISGTNTYIDFCKLSFAITSTSSALFMNNCEISTNLANTTCLTTVTSQSASLRNCILSSGTASAISIGASTTVEVGNCVIQSSNAAAVTGAGTFNFTNLSYSNSGTSVINPTTEVASYTELGKYKAKGQPCFMAWNNTATTNNTGDGTAYTLIFGTESFDQNGNFDGTSTFTAPVTGKYQFNCNCLAQNLAAASTMSLQLVVAGTSARTYTFGNTSAVQTAAGNQPIGFSIIVNMTATDTATVVLNVGGGTKTVGVYGGAADPRTNFSGHLVA